MSVKLNLIAAACENMGIGRNNDLPWRLRMTSNTKDTAKKNVVIMGRRTWDSIPPKFKPLSNRINFVLSRTELNLSVYEHVYSFASLKSALDKLNDEQFHRQYENVWVIGGSHIYKESMDSSHFYRLYLTKILKHFDCDTFMPPLKDNLKEVSDPEVPQVMQKEKDVEFIYKVYENPDFKP